MTFAMLRLLLLAALLISLSGLPPSATAEETSAGSGRVLARLGQQPITDNEVDFYLGRDIQLAGSSAPLSPAALQTTVQLIALQRQALQTLRNLGQAATRDELDAWIVSQGTEVDPQGASADASADQIVQRICDRFGMDELAYREFVAFRLSWRAYLARHLTSENIAKHFANQRARFDGTFFTIDRVSIAVPAGASAQRAAAEKHLAAVRDRVVSEGKEWEELISTNANTSWETISNTRVRGSGDLDPTLVGALLDLKAGQISQPVHTASGVHLLRLSAIEPGQLELEEVADEVRAHMLVFLLEFLARQSQEKLPLVAGPVEALAK